MRAVEYVGRVLPDGHLELPARARHELRLVTNEDVKVILLRKDDGTEEDPERAQKRHEAVAGILALRHEFAGMDFNLTEELIRAREEEGE